jgi:hypothetical protein
VNETFLILVGLHLHPGTCAPCIYRMSTRTVLSVLDHVAFTLLVQNYLCTTLPRIYTVVHNSLYTVSTIVLLIPILYSWGLRSILFC